MSLFRSERIDRKTLTRDIIEAGNAYQAAVDDEGARHTAAVRLLRLRLQFFTGYVEPVFTGPDLDDLCAKLTSREVHTLTQLCWNAYTGGMEHMREVDA